MTLAADSVSVRIADAVLLRDVSLAVEAGELLALVGPSGAGKSTLLRVLSGERHPTSGSVRLAGCPIGQISPATLARARAVLPQQSALRFPLRALEVVRLGRLPHPGRGESPHDLDIARAALEFVEADHLADRLAPSLSGGEQQRVQLARALAQVWEATPEHPWRALLLDEPGASLDAGHAARILGRVRRFARATATAVVVVSHDLGAAAQLADRVALLHAGARVADGLPVDVLTPERLHRCFGVGFDVVPAPHGRGLAVLPYLPDDLEWTPRPTP